MARSKPESGAVGSPFQVPATVLVPYASLNPAKYNPRKISPRQLDALKEGIKKHGFLDPIVVQRQGMTIVGGHQRYRSAKEIAVEAGTEVPDLPCIVIDITDREAKKLNISLNKVGGEFDKDLLSELLQDLHRDEPFTELDSLSMGFDDLSSLLESSNIDLGSGSEGGTQPTPTTRAPSLSLDFETKEQRDLVKAALAKEAKKDEPTGATLARVLGLRAKSTRKVA
jgi:hypothetical protein